MKTNHRLLLTLVVLTGFVFLTSCTQWKIIKKSKGEVIKPTISLQVVDNGGEGNKLVVTGKLCKEHDSVEGCVTVGKSKVALITFKLKDSPGWYFEEFKLCKGNSKNSLDCTLNKWEQVETFATDKTVSELTFPGDKGVIDLTQLTPNLTNFYLFDYNSVEQDYFYTITVCNSDDTSCIVTDPPIENEGRGGLSD